MSPREVPRLLSGALLGLLLGLGGLPRPAAAADCGICSWEGLPSSRDLRFGLFPGELVTQVSLMGTLGDRAVTGPTGSVRDEGAWLQGRLVALLGFSHSLGLELELPVSMAFTATAGETDASASGSASASNVGPGDAWLSLRWARPIGPWIWLASAGLSVPFGPVVGVPLPGSSPGDRAQSLGSLGTGSFDPLLRLALTRRLGPLHWTLVGQGRIPILMGRGGQRAGARLFASLGMEQRLHVLWRYGLSVDLLHVGGPLLERDAGGLQLQQAAGQQQLLASGFLQLRLNPWSARLSLHAPVHGWGKTREWNDGVQGAWRVPLAVQLTLVTAFDVGT